MIGNQFATNDLSNTKLWIKRAGFFLSLALVVQIIFALLEYKLPSTDVFLFKEAGSQFALNNEFKAADLPHFPPHQKVWFSYYPPIYPFSFGVWAKVFGFGLKQSLAFDAVIRILRSFVLFCFFILLCNEKRSQVYFRELFLFTLLSFVTTEGDRPDDLALFFGVLSFLCLRWRSSAVLAGIFLGLTASTSPAGGFYFGLGHLFFYRDWKKTAMVLGVSFLVFNAITVPIQWLDRDAYLRFSKQLPLSVFPYMQRWRAEHRILGTYYDWRGYFWSATDLVRPYFHVILLFFGLLFWKPRTLYQDRLVKFNILFFYLWLVIWTLQPFYLWFLLLISICVVLSYCKERWVFAALLVLLFPIFKQDVKFLVNSLLRPQEEKTEYVLEKLKREIPAEETLVVTPDQYFTFRKHWKLANITYVCPYLNEFRYVYVSRFQSSHKNINNYPFFCVQKENLFELKKDISYYEPFYNYSYYVKGNSGRLYEQK